MQVINTSRVTCHVPVVNADGSTDTITVQPQRGRVHLAEGQRVQMGWRPPLGVLVNAEASDNKPVDAPTPVPEISNVTETQE